MNPNINNMNMNNNYLNMNMNNQNMGTNNINNNNKKNPFSVIKNELTNPNMNQLLQMNNQQQSFNGKRSFDAMNQNFSVNDGIQGSSNMNQFNQMGQDSSQISLNPQRKTNKEFQGVGEDRGAEQEKKVQQLLKDYDGNNFKYTSDSFTYQANQFLKRIASENHAQKIASKYPLFKMLRSIVKKFLFNELEIVFFAYILRENQWKIDDERIKQCAPKVKDFMNQNELHDHLEYLQLLLYLILNAYAVKYYLNDMAEMEMYEAHIQTLVPEFSNLFSYWSKKFATTSLKINPKVLNKVFSSLSVKAVDNSKKTHEDYNQLVDNIIQISPPYNNSDKQGEQNVTKKDSNNNSSANGGSGLNPSGGVGGIASSSNQANTQSMNFLNNLYNKKVQQQQQQQQSQQSNTPSTTINSITGGVGGNASSNNQANASSMNFLNNLYNKKVQQQEQSSQNQQSNTPSTTINSIAGGLGANGSNATGNSALGSNTNNFGFSNLGNISGNNSSLNSNFQQLGQQSSQNQSNQQAFQNINNSYFGQSDYIGMSGAPDSFKDLRFNQSQKPFDSFNQLGMDNNFDSQKSQIDSIPMLKNQNQFAPLGTNIDKIIDSSGSNNVQNQFGRFNAQNMFTNTINNLGTSQFPTSGNQFNLANNSNFQNSLLQQGFSNMGGANDFQMKQGNVIVPKPNKIQGINDNFMNQPGHKLEDDGNLSHQILNQNFQQQDMANHAKKIQSTASAFLHHDN